MKKFTSLLIGLSLALAGVAFAQPPTEETPPPGKTQGTTEKAGKTRGKKTAKPEATLKAGAAKEGVTARLEGPGKPHKGKAANPTQTHVCSRTTGATNENRA